MIGTLSWVTRDAGPKIGKSEQQRLSGSSHGSTRRWCRYRLEHVAPASPTLPMSWVTGAPRCLRPEERKPIDSGGKNRLVVSVLHGYERHVVNRVPAPIRAREAGVDVAAGAHTDAKAPVRREVFPLEGPEHRVADIGARYTAVAKIEPG